MATLDQNAIAFMREELESIYTMTQSFMADMVEMRENLLDQTIH
jgi:hypothetical protein